MDPPQPGFFDYYLHDIPVDHAVLDASVGSRHRHHVLAFPEYVYG